MTHQDINNIETMELTLPASWASALFNSDTSGMNEADEKALQNFTDEMLLDYDFFDAVDIKDEPYFSSNMCWSYYDNDITAGDVVEYTIKRVI